MPRKNDFVPYGGYRKAWNKLPKKTQEGLELAADICRMYGDGERWADAILSKGEQIRAQFYNRRPSNAMENN